MLSSEQVVVQKNLIYPASIKEIMHTWILQMNYPVVTVTIPQNGVVRATQQRFLRNPEAKDPLVYISPFGYYGFLIIWNKMEPFVIFCKIIGFKGAFEITFNNISRECIVIHIHYLLYIYDWFFIANSAKQFVLCIS